MNRVVLGKTLGALLVVVLAAVLAFRWGAGVPLAVVAESQGGLQRDFAEAIGTWVHAEPGDELRVGEGVQTGPEGIAVLRLAGGGELRMQPDTVIRFSSQAPKADQAAFDVQLGAVQFRGGEHSTELVTSFGAIVIESGATVALSSADAALQVVVEIGQVVVGGQSVGVGSTIVIELGGVTIEPSAPQRTEAVAHQALEPVRATVVGLEATVRSDTGEQPLGAGEHTLAPDTRLVLGSETTVTLAQQGRRATLVGTGSFVVAPAPGVLVTAETGMLRVHESGAVRIDVPGGSIVVAARGDVAVEASAKGTDVSVAAESAELSAGGVARTIRRGQGALIVSGGELTLRGVGLPYADLELAVGKSVRVHDPQPPSVVNFSYAGRCPDAGVVELLKGRRVEDYGVAAEHVALPVSVGRTSYQVRCLQPDGSRSAVMERGRVEVVADRATRKVPARAPVTKLVADGRNYTVLYQSKLPVVQLLWPAPPSAERYQLVHASSKGRTVMDLAAPNHRFESGQLGEGKHTFYFEASGKLSRRSSVSIAFDNASPAVRLTSPPVLRLEPGQALSVAGVAMPGSKVAVDGKAVSVDRQGRFRVAVPLQSERRAVAIHIVHPRLGERVYLRRAEGP